MKKAAWLLFELAVLVAYGFISVAMAIIGAVAVLMLHIVDRSWGKP